MLADIRSFLSGKIQNDSLDLDDSSTSPDLDDSSTASSTCTEEPLEDTKPRKEEIASIITAMCFQEASGYFKHSAHQSLFDSSVPSHVASSDVECRNKIVKWYYQLVDLCKFNREIVEIAMSYLDRFMLTPAGMEARKERESFQLAAMTCLYTAVKVHESVAMDVKLVSTLGRGAHSPKQVERMEATILTALKWRMNPPTSLAFVRQFTDLLPEGILTPQMWKAAYDLSMYQLDLAVSDYRFIAVRPSVVAFCAFMNSMEFAELNEVVLGYVGQLLSQSIGVTCNDASIISVQTCLNETVLRQQPAAFVRIAGPNYIAPPKASDIMGSSGESLAPGEEKRQASILHFMHSAYKRATLPGV